MATKTDPDPAKTTPDPKPTPAATPPASGVEGDPKKPAGLDLSAKVTLADGTEATVGSLIADAHDKAKLQSELAKVKDLEKAYATLMSSDVTEKEYEAALRKVMVAQGYTKAQIDDFVEEQLGAGAEEGDKSGGAEFKELQKEIAELKKAQKADLDRRKADETKRLGKELDKSVRRGLDGSKEVRILLGKIKDRDGEEASAKARKAMEARVDRAARDHIQQRYSRGETFEETRWFGEAVTAAIKAEVEFLRSAIGDFSSLGRSPGTDTGQFILDREPVKPPEPSKITTRSEKDQARKQLTDWAVDALVRDAAAAGSKTKA